jgi:hypothetical protein
MEFLSLGQKSLKSKIKNAWNFHPLKICPDLTPFLFKFKNRHPTVDVSRLALYDGKEEDLLVVVASASLIPLTNAATSEIF